VQLLEHDRVLMALSPEAIGLLGDLEILGSVDSTNALAMAKAASEPGHGAVIVAEHQRAGRGRRGKRWVSPYAGNLYMSTIWDFSQGAGSLDGLSLAVGVAISDALTEAGLADCRLKWPNDVLLDGRKLGGILLELQGDVSGQFSVVVGVGINVAMSRTAGESIDQAWTDIRSQPGGGALNRNELLGILLSHVLMALDTFSKEGFSAFHARWSALDAHAGRKVCLQQGSNQLEGVALGIDASGALKIQTPQGIQRFHGGEISLRSVE
jgi:BirA family biotin operon repressor/biotin-[acetyl-CoA-carboxylase] ligase